MGGAVRFEIFLHRVLRTSSLTRSTYPASPILEFVHPPFTQSTVAAFQRAARHVPSYGELLKSRGYDPEKVVDLATFASLPVLDKARTFVSKPIEQLYANDTSDRIASVLTSSGHSGKFAFGVSDAAGQTVRTQMLDYVLDEVFAVRSSPTLLINGLPMGVKVATEACTLAETSVRPDMIIGLVKGFGSQFKQIVLVGETAFIKHTLELGIASGIDWPAHRIQVIVGEEPLAENARIYLEGLLGIDRSDKEHALIVSSMGVAELGLNLFAEAPPKYALIRLRRLLHTNAELREHLLGPTPWVPSLFTYDPARFYVEFIEGRLIVTTLDLQTKIPLIRYATGDRGRFLEFPESLRGAFLKAGIAWEQINQLPLVAIDGRGDHASAGAAKIFPEAVKEGIYFDASLAELITANFRLISGPEKAHIRLQLSPGVSPNANIALRFSDAIGIYVKANVQVSCEPYETFGSGMVLDFERKFNYLGP